MRRDLLIKNIACIVQVEEISRAKVSGAEMASLGTLSDAYLYTKDGLINNFGPMSDLKEDNFTSEVLSPTIINAEGKFVFPSFLSVLIVNLYTV